jgi:sugar phosphate isomerase/epimerase
VVTTVDFSHAAIQCINDQLDYVQECRTMAPQVGHLHIHENFALPAA